MSEPTRPRPVGGKFLAATALLATLLCLLLSTTAFSAMTVDNTAQASYSLGPLPVVVDSNLVSIVVRTPSTIDILQYTPGVPGAADLQVKPTSYRIGNDPTAPFIELGNPVAVGFGSPIDLSIPVPLLTAPVFHEGEPVFIILTDRDQNLDLTTAETVIVTLVDSKTNDTEILRLTESGPDTGIFIGYIQSTASSAVQFDGLISVAEGSDIEARYVDIVDGSDTSAKAALVDPFGIVFDSRTGNPVDGATVTLIDATTGAPATVYGDDGVSPFPATLTSGGTVTDDSGRHYDFPPGGFRFPFLRPTTYQLRVTPPAGYTAPSTATTESLRALPGGPFTIVEPGSRGETFILNAGPAMRIDIPVDPMTGVLWLRKTAGKSIVSAGEFLPYELTLENTDTVAAVPSVSISDTLPPGFRYRKGSARINNAAAADPSISADGRTLTFAVGTLTATSSAVIRYVVEVTAGAVTGRAVNTAVATGGAVTSNRASAAVQVQEAFLQSRGILMGRVAGGGCTDPPDDREEGVEGVGIYLEDGTFVVTGKRGMFHFEGVRPGTHVVQLDLDSVPKKYEVLACEENSRFAGTSYSQFVDLQGGTLWRADFHLRLKPAATGEAGLELRSVLKKAEAGRNSSETVEYSAPIRIGAVPVRNLRLTVMLPDGVAYQAGTSSLNGVPRPEPSNMENVLTFRLGELPGNWEGTVRFNAAVSLAGTSGELATRALLTFDTPVKKNERTPVADNVLVRKSVEERRAVPDIVLRPRFAVLSAELSEQDKKALDRLLEEMKQIGVKQITVTGHTDSNPILGRGMEKFRDNYALSEARAGAVGRYIAGELKLAPEQVTHVGKGPDEPVATNETEEGRALNRRVELTVKSEKLIVSNELRNEKDRSGAKSVATVGLRPGETWGVAEESKAAAGGKDMPEYDAAWLNTAESGVAWLWPPEGYHPPIPSMKLAVKQDPRKTLKLFLNGEEVDPLYLDGTVKRQDNTVAVSVWRGVHVEEGDNLFEAVQFDATGAETARLKLVIHYSTPPVKAEFVPAKSRLTADGKNPPVIAVRLTDKDGHPAREGVIGEYTLDPPYSSRQQADELRKHSLTATANDRLKCQVGDDGVAFIELQPTTRTGEAVVRLNLVSGPQEVRAWLKPDYRDWILVGLAEGTLGYNVASGHMENLRAAGTEEDFFSDGRLAFYAKGKVKGEWLLTISYDSAGSPVADSNGLFQNIDPNAFYTLYGDATQQNHDAASAKKLYVKMERDQFYAMFGDYNTGLTITELSRYSRSLTGFKSEYRGKNLEFNAFGSETGQSFVKDEIRGDGTSGLYRLSRSNIVINSEKITIEARDRFHSEVVVSSRPLGRFVDYSIDYDAGTIFFKQPVASRDEQLNPVFIVVDYETESGDKALSFGGRAGARLLDGKLKVGATYIHEGHGSSDGNLYGLDAAWDVAKGTRVRAEVATSDNEIGSDRLSGSAYLAEVAHTGKELEAKAYIREQGESFGLGQQKGSEAGTRKAGGDAAYRMTEKLTVGGEAYRQYNLATGAFRDFIEGKTSYTEKNYAARMGLRYAADHLGDGSVQSSTQMTAGGSWQTLNNRLTLRLDHEQSLWSQNANADFPTRTILGADFKATEKVTLFAQQEFTKGEAADTDTTRIGMKSAPWKGGTLNTSMEQQFRENEERLFAVVGLAQTWQLTDSWTVDAGLDRSQTIRHREEKPLNVNVPAASGGEDFTAVSLGANYKVKNLSWSNRVELRDGETEDKWGVITGVVNEQDEKWGWTGRFQLFQSRTKVGSDRTDADLRLGLAYRPPVTRWIILDRLDLLYNHAESAGSSLESRRIVNNILANWRPDRKWQISFQYGAKYVLETIDAKDYSGYTDLIGVEGRYDVTKKWDVGVRGSILHSWNGGEVSYSAGPSVGYNVVENAWVSLGYNLAGFTDKDFSAADYTAQGPFVRFRIKFDQNSVRDAVKWFGYQ